MSFINRRYGTWDALYEYLDFAIYASDEDFKTWIFSRIDKGSVIDYFIFINIIKAVDNYGKNIIMTKHDKTSSFLMIPWDLDATWGRRWDSYCVSAVSILTNRFYERLFTLDPEGFTESLKLRWNEVRNTLVDEETIFGKIAQYKTVLVLSGAIDRENKVWPSHPLNLYWEEYEMQQWYSTRLLYLDNYFQDL